MSAARSKTSGIRKGVLVVLWLGAGVIVAVVKTLQYTGVSGPSVHRPSSVRLPSSAVARLAKQVPLIGDNPRDWTFAQKVAYAQGAVQDNAVFAGTFALTSAFILTNPGLALFGAIFGAAGAKIAGVEFGNPIPYPAKVKVVFKVNDRVRCRSSKQPTLATVVAVASDGRPLVHYDGEPGDRYTELVNSEDKIHVEEFDLLSGEERKVPALTVLLNTMTGLAQGEDEALLNAPPPKVRSGPWSDAGDRVPFVDGILRGGQGLQGAFRGAGVAVIFTCTYGFIVQYKMMAGVGTGLFVVGAIYWNQVKPQEAK